MHSFKILSSQLVIFHLTKFCLIQQHNVLTFILNVEFN